MLTVKEVAELKGCSERYVQKLVSNHKLESQESVNSRNRTTYLIPINALDPKLQQKYYQQHKPDSINVPPVSKSPPAPIDSYTADERAEIDFWTRLTREWQEYRNKPGVTSKAEVDERFAALCKLQYPERGISVDTLYRRWKAVKEDDLASLIDKRGSGKKANPPSTRMYGKRFCTTTLTSHSTPSSGVIATPRCGRKTNGQSLWQTSQHIQPFTAICRPIYPNPSRCLAEKAKKLTMTGAHHTSSVSTMT